MQNLNLVLHAGGSQATLEQISAVETPQPDGIWHPISHRNLYDQVTSALSGMNMRVVNEQHALARNGQRYFSLLQVANCQEVSTDYAYVLGLRNSHDKSYPAGLVVGSGVFVCDNLAFSGEIKIARKHTTFIERDLPRLTGRAVGMLQEKWTDMNVRFDAYKQKEITDIQVHDMVIRGLDLGACTAQQIPHIVNEWRHPRHVEFAQAGKTAWRLFNAFTEVGKESGVFVLPKRTQSLHALMDAECGIVGRAQRITADAIDAEVEVAPANN
jgi:hypothetical protein